MEYLPRKCPINAGTDPLWSVELIVNKIIKAETLSEVNLGLDSKKGSAVPFIIQAKPSRLSPDLRALWFYREVLYFLIWRDVKVRYKQAAIGVAWAVIQPLMAMLIFTIVFGRFARVPSDGLPYPAFAYAALLPWDYFAQAITRSGNSLVANSTLISKVYFPRLILPIAMAVSPLVDSSISFLILLGMIAWFGIVPTWTICLLPLFLLMALVTALAVCLFLSALNVRYRDVGHAIPFLVQIWMYASPVAYSSSLVPERWRALYGLNPMVGVIDGFRWALLGSNTPNIQTMAVSGLVVILLLFVGVTYFRRMERSFADVI